MEIMMILFFFMGRLLDKHFLFTGNLKGKERIFVILYIEVDVLKSVNMVSKTSSI